MAVWGETYAKIYRVTYVNVPPETPDAPGIVNRPVVEAYDTSMGLLVRQWDGKHSGANHYVQTLEQFVELVRELERKPFVRF